MEYYSFYHITDPSSFRRLSYLSTSLDRFISCDSPLSRLTQSMAYPVDDQDAQTSRENSDTCATGGTYA